MMGSSSIAGPDGGKLGGGATGTAGVPSGRIGLGGSLLTGGGVGFGSVNAAGNGPGGSPCGTAAGLTPSPAASLGPLFFGSLLSALAVSLPAGTLVLATCVCGSCELRSRAATTTPTRHKNDAATTRPTLVSRARAICRSSLSVGSQVP